MSSFFVSYNKADKAVAEWIAWTLEEAGHTVVIQAWDFRPGGNFILDMQVAAAGTDKTIVVLSENYLNAKYTQPEWAAAFADDPESQSRKLIPVRVGECQPTGLLRSLVYVDLVGLEEEEAHQAILKALLERVKPPTKPPFSMMQRARTIQTKPQFPSPPPSIPWNVPYERNAFFTGREAVLQTLYQQLNQDETVALSQTQAISGLGGIGKTQTAVEYAYRHRQDYQAVFWVRAETDLELRTGFVEIARLLNLPEQDAQDPNDTIQAVKRWLESTPGWLLIFDNADHPEWLKPFRPRQAQGHILLTSRAQTFDALGIAQPVSLQKMPPQEAKSFLFIRTGREADGSDEQSAVATLAAELGYLPLALEQAGAYILAQQISFQGYLKSYRKRRLSLLEKSKPITGNYPESVATTWSLNFSKVAATSKAAADLLTVSAFLSPDAIPYEVFERGASQLGEDLATELAEMSDDPIVFAEVLAPLTRYSLVRTEPSMQAYSIARLVQEVVKAEMDETHRHLWAERTIKAVTQAFPKAKYGNWPDCDRLLPHAKIATQLVNTEQIESETAALLLVRTGDYLSTHAQYSQAEPLYKDALAMRKRLLGDKHPDVALILNNLAALYDNQGRYSDAEPLFQDALAMSKRLLGDEHPDVARSLENLAKLYNNQGRYSEAEPLYKDALAMSKRLLGDEHPDVARSLNNLALLYNNQGRYSEAEPLFQDALAMSKQLLGNEHPNVFCSLNNLALLYNNQGRYSEAEPLFQDALAMSKRLLGNEHLDVAGSLNNLAGLYGNKGRYNKAEPLLQDALAIKKRLLGDEHPDVALSLNNLAGLYENKGRYSKAEPLYKDALAMRKRLLGDEHPDVASSLNNLAELYNNQGRYSKAEPLFQDALAMRKRLLGDEHPDVARCLNSLALLYYNQERYSEAEPLYKEALAMRKRLLGDEHPDVGLSLNDLAALYYNQKLYSKAEPLYKEALRLVEQGLGLHHPHTKVVRENLQRLRERQNRRGRKTLNLIRQLIDKSNS